METYLKGFPLYHDKYSEIARNYIDATRFLYSNGQGDIWFVKGEKFSNTIINQPKEYNTGLGSIVLSYASLLWEKFKKTRNKQDEDAAFQAYDKAISLAPQNAVGYQNRGGAYRDKGDLDRAIADYDSAISLNPKAAVSYNNRGYAYGKKGDLDHAIYDKAISLDPKPAVAYHNRGYAYGIKGNLDRAIADYANAISLDPKPAVAYHNRGYAYKIKGNLVDRL